MGELRKDRWIRAKEEDGSSRGRSFGASPQSHRILLAYRGAAAPYDRMECRKLRVLGSENNLPK